MVRREHDLTDVNHIQLLVSIGRKYQSQDQDASALRVLEEAYKLSRGVTDRSTRAQAACALGNAASGSGDSKRAEALIQEGFQGLTNEPQFVLDRIYCLERGSRVSIENGEASKAVARALTAEQLLQGSPLRSDVLEADTLMGLAEAYRSAGQFVEANNTFDRASKALATLGRDDTQEAGTLFNNWGLMLLHSGRILEAERALRRAINISQENQAEEGVSPQLLNNYAATLIDLDRFDEASNYADRAFADAQKAGDEILIEQTLLMRARVYRGQHDLVRSDANVGLGRTSNAEEPSRRTLRIRVTRLGTVVKLIGEGRHYRRDSTRERGGSYHRNVHQERRCGRDSAASDAGPAIQRRAWPPIVPRMQELTRNGQ